MARIPQTVKVLTPVIDQEFEDRPAAWLMRVRDYVRTVEAEEEIARPAPATEFGRQALPRQGAGR
jgi:hypothetical protein